MKKNIKLLAIGLIGFVLSLNAVSAKEIKDLNTLGNDVLAVNKDAEGFYLVGEYAFTTGYKTTVQDVMLAARSIQAKDQNGKINTDGIFKEMTIYTIDAHYNNNGEIDSWTIGKSLYGDNTLEEDLKSGIQVKYIDYQYLKEDVKIDTDALLNAAFTSYDKTDLFTFNVNSLAAGSVTATVQNLKENIALGMKSGVIDVLTKFLEDNSSVTSIDFATDIEGVEPFTFTRETTDTDIVAWVSNNLLKVLGENADGITADLIGKSFTATLNLGSSDTENYFAQKNDGKSVTYTITFDGTRSQVDVNGLVSTASQNSKLNGDLFEVSYDNNETIIVNVKQVDKSIAVGMQSGVFATAKDLLENENVKSVEFSYPGAESLIITKDTSDTDIINWLTNNLLIVLGEDATGLTYDLVNKEYKVKVNLYSFAEKTAGQPSEYTIKFTGDKKEIDVDKLVETSIQADTLNGDMFESKYADGTVTVDVKELNESIAVGMGSGVLATLQDLMTKNPDIESIEFAYDGVESFTYTSETSIDEILDWVANNLSKVLGEDADGITADLIEKSFTATVNLKYYAKKETTNKEKYIFTFTGTKKQENIDNLVEKVKESINTDMYNINIAEDKVTATINDVDEKIELGMDSNIFATAKSIFTDNVKEIHFTYNDVKLTLTKEMLDDPTYTELLNWWAENSSLIFSSDELSDGLTNKDLLGKSVTIEFVLYSFAENSGNNDTYTLSFEAVKYNLTFDYGYEYSGSETTKEIKIEDGTLFTDKTILEPVRENYKFLGWFEEGKDDSAFDFSKSIKNNVKLNAKWQELLTKSYFEELTKNVTEGVDGTPVLKAYHVTLSGNDIAVTYDDPNTSIAGQFSAGGTGVVDSLKKFLEDPKIKSISIITKNLGLETEETKEVTTQVVDETVAQLKKYQVTGWIEALLKSMDIGTDLGTFITLKNSSFDGKSVSFRINLNDGIEFDEGFDNLFTITFGPKSN